MDGQSDYVRVACNIFARFGTIFYAQSVIINEISASELRRKLIKCALPVGLLLFLFPPPCLPPPQVCLLCVCVIIQKKERKKDMGKRVLRFATVEHGKVDQFGNVPDSIYYACSSLITSKQQQAYRDGCLVGLSTDSHIRVLLYCTVLYYSCLNMKKR